MLGRGDLQGGGGGGKTKTIRLRRHLEPRIRATEWVDMVLTVTPLTPAQHRGPTSRGFVARGVSSLCKEACAGPAYDPKTAASAFYPEECCPGL